MALHCASNELLRGLLGLGSTQHGGHRFSVGNLLRVVRAPLMVEVTMAVEVTMVTAMMEVTVVVEVTMVTAMVEATMVEATMVEVTTVVVVTVVVVVVATVVVEVTAMAAMVEVAVMVKVTAVERFRGRLLDLLHISRNFVTGTLQELRQAKSEPHLALHCMIPFTLAAILGHSGSGQLS